MAKLNGIREFKTSKDFVITGCTTIPQPNKKYCHLHEEADSPVVTADRLNEKSKKALQDKRKSTATYKEAGQDDLYVIESIQDIKKNKIGKLRFLVKWVGFGDEDSTWESDDAIPKFIQEFYLDRSKLRMKLPNP